ncbi:S-layer homology domain-containing protein [Paenibacillus sp. FSL K6-0276]|uniref:S-layer homology domain-containing protein n=1 Tax=Paenibacillus sp. FSL K6-0276 TaxID=2921450 RepID=UPI0030EF9ABB
MTKVTVKSSSASGVFVAALHPVTFGDISSHWAKNEIEMLASRLILTGQSTDIFAPQKSVSRAEFAAMLIRSLGLVAGNTTTAFSDVSDLSWYAADARALKLLNLGAGESGANPATIAFTDSSSISSWAKEAVNVLTAKGIMKGQSAGNFAPGNDTIRAEAAVILARLLKAAGLLN